MGSPQGPVWTYVTKAHAISYTALRPCGSCVVQRSIELTCYDAMQQIRHSCVLQTTSELLSCWKVSANSFDKQTDPVTAQVTLTSACPYRCRVQLPSLQPGHHEACLVVSCQRYKGHTCRSSVRIFSADVDRHTLTGVTATALTGGYAQERSEVIGSVELLTQGQ